MNVFLWGYIAGIGTCIAALMLADWKGWSRIRIEIDPRK